MHIRNMNFHHRCFNGSNGIANGHGCMCIAARVQDNAIMVKSHALQFGDQLSLYITLKKTELHIGKLLF